MITVTEISRRLAQRAESVCQMLLPGGRQVKNLYVCGNIHGGEGDSLRVAIDGHYAGNWKDWATDEHGDLLDLWRLVRNLSPGESVQQAKAFLGITDPVHVSRPKAYGKAPAKPDAPPNPAGRAFAWLTGVRKLASSTIAAFRVATEAGAVPAIVFPCYSPQGELVNRSYRSLPKDGEKKKVWQDAGCAPCLFGWHALSSSAFKDRTILLCEGQIDCMTWFQWGIPALSIPNGSGQTWIEFEWDNLAVFEKIFIAFDNDDSGRENAAKTISRLGPHRCHQVEIPVKDANEALQRGATAANAREWLETAKEPAVTGLILARDMKDRILAEMAPKPEPFTLRCFGGDWSRGTGLYFRPGEVTLWTGVSHAGKSTFVNFLTSAILEAAMGVFIASLEIRPETTMRKLITARLAGCGAILNAKTADSWLMEYGDRTAFADVVGFIEQDRLMEMMRFAFQRFGITNFVIDSLMRIAGLEEDFPAQGEFMNRLQEFAKGTGVHVHLVVHPRKATFGGRVAMLDIKGSTLIVNNADNIVVVSRNAEKMEISKERDLTPAEAAWHDTEITVEKQRESGWIGGFYFKFNPRDYTYQVCNRPETEKKKPQRTPHND